MVFVDIPPGIKCCQETHTSSGSAGTQMEIWGLEGYGCWHKNSSCSHGVYILLVGEKWEIDNKYKNQNNSNVNNSSMQGIKERDVIETRDPLKAGLFVEVTMRLRSAWEESANLTQARRRWFERGTPNAKAQGRSTFGAQGTPVWLEWNGWENVY